MAVIKIKIICGCGFETNNPVKAAKHSDEYKHSLEIRGEVIKAEARKRRRQCLVS